MDQDEAGSEIRSAADDAVAKPGIDATEEHFERDETPSSGPLHESVPHHRRGAVREHCFHDRPGRYAAVVPLRLGAQVGRDELEQPQPTQCATASWLSDPNQPPWACLQPSCADLRRRQPGEVAADLVEPRRPSLRAHRFTPATVRAWPLECLLEPMNEIGRTTADAALARAPRPPGSASRRPGSPAARYSRALSGFAFSVTSLTGNGMIADVEALAVAGQRLVRLASEKVDVGQPGRAGRGPSSTLPSRTSEPSGKCRATCIRSGTSTQSVGDQAEVADDRARQARELVGNLASAGSRAGGNGRSRRRAERARFAGCTRPL